MSSKMRGLAIHFIATFNMTDMRFLQTIIDPAQKEQKNQKFSAPLEAYNKFPVN